jgi:hypothetical protein
MYSLMVRDATKTPLLGMRASLGEAMLREAFDTLILSG